MSRSSLLNTDKLANKQKKNQQNNLRVALVTPKSAGDTGDENMGMLVIETKQMSITRIPK